jgi:glycosyltransferase involved in cell wall biosynthesis
MGTTGKSDNLQTDEPIRFLTVVTRLELGGAQQVALNTLALLPPERFRRYLIAGAGGLLDSQARALAGVVVELWPGFKHPVRPVSDLITCWRLARFMRRERIQIVHTHSSKAGFLGRLAAAWAKVPVVLHTVHGWPFHDFQPAPIRGLYIMLERWAAQRTTRLIAVSAATRAKGLAQGIGRDDQYAVIFPGSDLSGFGPGSEQGRAEVRAEFGFEPDAVLVGMIGNLKPQKAPLDFIAAAAVVAAQFPRARFLLAGDGPLRAAATAKIASLGLTGRVVLAGWRRDVPRLLAACDIMAHSARWEGLPCVFAQAQASRLAIVATDVEGAREAIESEHTGLLVPPGDPSALGQAVIRLLVNPALRLRLAAAGQAHAPAFGLGPMLQRLQALYLSEGLKSKPKNGTQA